MPNNDQKGIALMVLSMASFALSDFFVKLASANFSLGQLLLFFGVGSSVCFYAVAYRRQLRVFSAQALEPPVLVRTAGEVIAGTFIILAITYGSLSGASAIMQIQPLSRGASSLLPIARRLRHSAFASDLRRSGRSFGRHPAEPGKF